MKEQKLSLKELRIDKTWTLFLDRDGVINHKIKGDYVREWTQFKFLPAAKDAIRILANIFGRIIVVTNQRGVARGLVQPVDLTDIHKRMVQKLRKAGGRIDEIYVCTHDRHIHCDCRKPKPGLALAAKRDFPSIVFSKSIMIGDGRNDMIFAKNLKMKSVFIEDYGKLGPRAEKPDFRFNNLYEFASTLKHVRSPWV